MIQAFQFTDLPVVYEIINDSAQAYKGIIPADRWHEPYMPLNELIEQIESGVQFFCYKEDGLILGVMGIQDKQDVMLIRHAYVRTIVRNKGIGRELLTYLCQTTTLPILIGTWADATWAIAFYQRNGFHLVNPSHKNDLLKTYWHIPERQVETSVVLSNKVYHHTEKLPFTNRK